MQPGTINWSILSSAFEEDEEYKSYRLNQKNESDTWEVFKSVEDLLNQFRNGRNPDAKFLKPGESDDIYEEAREIYVNERANKELAKTIEEMKSEALQKRIDELKESSLLSGRYLQARFETTEVGNNDMFDHVLNRCWSYAHHAKDVLEAGQGLYIFGDCGVGKTHLVACIANDLINNYYSVIFTNVDEIIKQIKSSWKDNENDMTEQSIINTYCSCDFLILDDFGTEKTDNVDSYVQLKMYDIINHRYLTNKPTIFTSNLNHNDLIKKGVARKIVDRVYEMSTAVFEIRGSSFRSTRRQDDINKLKF